jgi:membrane protein
MIWGSTPEPTIGAAIRTKLTAIAMVFGVSLLLLLSIILNASLAVAVRYVRPLPWWRSLWTTFVPLSSAAMATAIFGLLYRYLPDTKVSWRHVWPGALLAGTAWELLRQAFTIYTTRYANYAAVYGAVGSTIALLSWIYLSAQILLFGAEFSVVYGEFKSRPRSWTDARASPQGPGLREQVQEAWHRLLDAIRRPEH